MLGSEGLFAFDRQRQRAVAQGSRGHCPSASPTIPTYEWGPASSPVIHGNVVIVQNDRYRDSFLIAFDLPTGKELWRSRSRRAAGLDDAARARRRWTHADDRDQLAALHPRPRPRAPDASAGACRIPKARSRSARRSRRAISPSSPAAIPSAGRPIYAIRVSDGSHRVATGARLALHQHAARLRRLLYIVTDNGILSAYQVSDGSASTSSGCRRTRAGSPLRRWPPPGALSRERGRQGVRRPRRSHLRVARHQRHERSLHGDAGACQAISC